MQTFVLAVLGMALMLGRPAAGAELARPPLIYQPPALVAAPFNWTGCYLGANAGVLRASTDWVDEIPGDPAFGLDFGNHASNGGIGGVQANCNYQVAAWVIGIMGDYDWTSATGVSTGIRSQQVAVSTTYTDVTFSSAMSSTDYTITFRCWAGDGSAIECGITNVTTSGFRVYPARNGTFQYQVIEYV